MKLILRVFLFCLLASLTAAVPRARASWVQDGVPICTATENQLYPQLVSDGAHGAILTWSDSRAGNSDIFVQRTDITGTPLWMSDGVILCAALGEQTYPEITSDGAGGAIVTWDDYRNGDSDIYVQRIDATGVVQWSGNGVPLCTASGIQYAPRIASDGAGGAIVTWYDQRGANLDIYVQRIDAAGAVQWASNGVPLCTATGDQYDQDIITDGSGGAIVCWDDSRSGNHDIYAQRINASGVVKWTTNGVALCTAAQNQVVPKLAPDGTGGAIVAWRDDRYSDSDIYAQRIDAAGAIQWTLNGISVCSAVDAQYFHEVVADGLGGAIVVWYDQRGATSDIYAQRIDDSGVAQWTLDGAPVCTAVGYQTYPQLFSDGAGGAIVTWRDSRNSSAYSIYAQMIEASGVARWLANGVALCTAANYRDDPEITSDGSGGAVITWLDDRSGNYDVYAQQIDSEGRPGYLAPNIHSVLDVPGDQGGSVHLTWDATPFDYLSGDITEYTVWRALTAQTAETMLAQGNAVLSGAGATPAFKSEVDQTTVLRLESVNGTNYYWELVATQGAYRLQGYAKTVATLFDSTGVTSDEHYFQVIAQTGDPGVFYVSAPDSGYSVDNLAPAAPASLTGTVSYDPDGMHLRWNRNHEPDLDSYRVYRGLSEGFIPGPASLIASTSDSTALDSNWTLSAGYYYKVSALDIHGNESGFALLTPETATGVELPQFSGVAALRQNVPNPFNPSTTIAFALTQSSHVSLKVYDLAGRLVRVLAEDDRPAGDYTVKWDGKDGSGHAAASGVYFYQLETGATVLSRRMTLMK